MKRPYRAPRTAPLIAALIAAVAAATLALCVATFLRSLVGGLLADVILKKADYKSAKSTVLSCGVFSIWVFGNFAPIFLNRESYMVMLTEGYGAEYAATLNTYMPMWIAPILLVACFVFGLVGGVIGKAICKKHFQRAGIA